MKKQQFITRSFFIAATLFFVACNNQKPEAAANTSPTEVKETVIGSYFEKLDLRNRQGANFKPSSQTDSNELRSFMKLLFAGVKQGKYKLYDASTELDKLNASTPVLKPESMSDSTNTINTRLMQLPVRMKKSDLNEDNIVMLKMYNIVSYTHDGRLSNRTKAFGPFVPDYDDAGNYRGDACLYWIVMD